MGLLLISLGGFSACTALREVAALRDVEFALEQVSEVRLAGVSLMQVRSWTDLTVTQAGRIALAVSENELPLELVVDVRAENPPSNSINARLTRMDWTLMVEERETVGGVVEQDYLLEPGQPRVIPIAATLDLMELADGGARDLLRAALSLLGAEEDAPAMFIRARPTIDTPLGPIRYPNPIEIPVRVGS